MTPPDVAPGSSFFADASRFELFLLGAGVCLTILMVVIFVTIVWKSRHVE